MKIGYPCINRTIGCTSNATFRLASYAEEKLVKKIESNLDCVLRMLQFNVAHDILFFRISSDIIPFASHPICTFDWPTHFQDTLANIGRFIRKHSIRISMHPDQFVVLNSPDLLVVYNSFRELKYHCFLLDALDLPQTAKVQIHIGGVYGDKTKALNRFVATYNTLPKFIKKRMVIENDDRLYNLNDCLRVHEQTGVPVLFDVFHHVCNPTNDSVASGLKKAAATWGKKDGAPMIDYSAQEKGKRPGAHAEHINSGQFKKFLKQIHDVDCDIMLEIKDKEKSAIKAVKIISDFRL